MDNLTLTAHIASNLQQYRPQSDVFAARSDEGAQAEAEFQWHGKANDGEGKEEYQHRKRGCECKSLLANVLSLTSFTSILHSAALC